MLQIAGNTPFDSWSCGTLGELKSLLINELGFSAIDGIHYAKRRSIVRHSMEFARRFASGGHGRGNFCRSSLPLLAE
jgi:hypothetical protein